MKYILLYIFFAFAQFPASAATATHLSCSMRKNVVISKFSYNLTTMKWGDHFMIASGVRKSKTENEIPFRVTRFQNGDDLVFFPEKEQYFMFYSGNTEPDKCIIEGTSIYQITQLPRYEKPEA